ncbi:MAG: DUF4189 domain-containing protein [Pseudomonadota bacterium]
MVVNDPKQIFIPDANAMKGFFTHLSLLFLFFVYADVRAEGRCPDGYFPIGGGNAGWEGCAPMGPETGVGDAGATQPQWETRWGAVATTDGAMGVSTAKNSQDSAEQEAVSQCQAHSGGKACQVRIAYYNQCVAVAWGDGGSRMTRSPDLRDAEATALNNCKKSTTNCDLYYSACSYAEPAQ